MIIKYPSITWGTSFVNSLSIHYANNLLVGSTPREGSVWKQIRSGEEDAWIRTDYTLSIECRWIPMNDTVNPLATGWTGDTGWRGFLEWARAKNQFRFYPNADSSSFVLSYLVDPMSGTANVEEDGRTYSVTLVMRNPTTPYDA